MDKQYQTDTDTYFSERHSSILVKFRNENDRNVALLQSIAMEKEKVKDLVSNEVWLKINDFIDLINLQRNIESKHLYIQGMKDFIDLSHFLDTDLISADFNEIVLNDMEGVVYYGDRKRDNENGSAIRLD